MAKKLSSSILMVWDPLVRVFHWALVFFFCVAYSLEDRWPELHSNAGYAVLGLVFFRLWWGFIGPQYALFSDFVRSPAVIIRYLRQIISGNPDRFLGHNPAGGVMVLLLLVSLAITACSGVALFSLEGSGPLAATAISQWPMEPLMTVHECFSDFTVILIAMHVVGVLISSWQHRENLIRAMFTGRKRPASVGSKGGDFGESDHNEY